VSSGASDGTNPLQGVVMMPSNVVLEGADTSGAVNGRPTVILACTGTNTPVTGCAAPQTHEFAISSTTITYAGGRTYLGVNVSSSDIVPCERVRITGSSVAANNGAWRVGMPSQGSLNCQQDATIPAAPTASLIYVPVNSGIVSSSIGGTLTGYSSNPSCAIGAPTSGGVQATCIAVESAGTLQGVFLLNRGRNYQSAPSCTLTGGGGAATCTVAIETACSSSCGTVHAELPMLETLLQSGSESNKFAIQVRNLTINGENLPDVIGLRSLNANEGSKFEHLFFTGFPERGLDMHLFKAQNAASVDDVRVTSSPSESCSVGTEGIYIGDAGPHGLKDITVDLKNCANPVNWGVAVDAWYNTLYVQGGHSEDALYAMVLGDGSGARNVEVLSWFGAPQSNLLTVDGAYQNEYSSAIKVLSTYGNATTGNPGTTDYSFTNVGRNNGSSTSYTISDDNLVNPAGTDGYHILDSVTSAYFVDVGTGGCVTGITSSALGANFGCGLSAATQGSGDNSTKVATDAFVQAAISTLAPLASPALTGTPIAPTPSFGDNSTKLATTAYVQNQTTGVPWLTVGRAGSVSGVTFSTTANQAELWGVVLTFPVTTTQVTYYVGTADNTTNSYDIGIYNSSGALVVHTGTKAGTAFAPTTGATTLSWAASATLQPGKYYLAITTNCTASCAAIDGDNTSAVSFLSKGVVSVSAGGTLNGSLTPPSDAWSYSSITPAWAVR